ncbi:Hsp20/alpha crystallin family protein [Haloplanus sp. C73]|uniref:Hsp20/alpha crystallin family protein n=1 Tax=Haloplanus sp. C73 TaxID=3421641 RepID=UPI003EBC6C43
MQPNNYFSDFDDLFERMTHAGALGRRDDVDFAVDIAHHDDELVVTADVPGFEKADFDIAVDGDRLTIHAESEAETGVDEETYVRRERHHHAMRRTVHLPVAADCEGASATYRNGVLTVTIPVKSDADVRHIDIE